MKDLALLLDLFGNSEETKLLIGTAFFVWCLQRQRNGGLNSGQKSANIVTCFEMKFSFSVLVSKMYSRRQAKLITIYENSAIFIFHLLPVSMLNMLSICDFVFRKSVSQ